MADPLDPQMPAVPWIYTVQPSGQSLATFLGDVNIMGLTTLTGGSSTPGLTLPPIVNVPAGGSTFTAAGAGAAINFAVPIAFQAPVAGLPAPVNEWPDPQFCIVDTLGQFTALNDNCTATLPAMSVTAYTLGVRQPTITLSSVANLVVGDLLLFTGSAAQIDPVFVKTPLRVQSINAGANTVQATFEYTSHSYVLAMGSANYNSTTGILTVIVTANITMPAATPIAFTGWTGSGADIGLINGSSEIVWPTVAAISASNTFTVQLPTGKAITINNGVGSITPLGIAISPAGAGGACTIMSMGDEATGFNAQLTSQVSKASGGATPGNAFSWISNRPGHVSRFKNVLRCLIQQVPANSYAYVNHQLPQEFLPLMGGQNRAVGCAVVILGGGTPAGGVTVQCVFNNAGAVQLAGNVASAIGVRTWISGAVTIGPNPTIYSEGFFLQNTTNADAFVLMAEFTAAVSANALTDGAFSTPRSQYIRFLASVSPWIGIDLTTPPSGQTFTMDWGQASKGAINLGTSILVGLLEGLCTTQNTAFLGQAGNVIYNPVLDSNNLVANAQIGNPNYYSFTQGYWHISRNQPAPTSRFYGGSGIAWYNLSFDLSGAILWSGP